MIRLWLAALAAWFLVAVGVPACAAPASDTASVQLAQAKPTSEAIRLAGWQSRDSNYDVAIAASGGSAPTVSYVSQASFPSGSGTATRTWTGVNIGNPAFIATRRVILSFGGFTGGVTLSTVTINGVTVDQQNVVGSGLNAIAFVSAVVTSGTTSVSIVATFSSNEFNANRLEVYNVDNSLMTSPTTPTIGSVSNSSGGVTSDTATVATTSGAFVLLAVIANSATSSATFSAATNTVTTDVQPNNGIAFGHANNVTVTASWSATASWTTTSTSDTLALASYR